MKFCFVFHYQDYNNTNAFFVRILNAKVSTLGCGILINLMLIWPNLIIF